MAFLQEKNTGFWQAIGHEFKRHPFALLFFAFMTFYACKGPIGEDLFYNLFADLWYLSLVVFLCVSYLIMVHAPEKTRSNFLIGYALLVFVCYVSFPFWGAIPYSFLVEQPMLLLVLCLFFYTRRYGKNFFVESSFLIILMYIAAPFLTYGMNMLFSTPGLNKIDLQFDQERLYGWGAVFVHAATALFVLMDFKLRRKNQEELQRIFSIYIMFLILAVVSVPLTVWVQHWLG